MTSDWVPMFKTNHNRVFLGSNSDEPWICRVCGNPISVSPKKHLYAYHHNRPIPEAASWEGTDPNVEFIVVQGSIYIRKQYVFHP